jgi:hypothetical protein
MGDVLFIMSKYGNLKRGDTREDGMIFWSYADGGERWVTSEQFNELKQSCRNYFKRNLPEKKFKRGDRREDGKIFWAYRKTYKNFECWMTEEAFNKEKERQKEYQRKREFKKPKIKVGFVRYDGLVYMGYNRASKNGQRWVVAEKYEDKKRKARERHFRLYHSDISFRKKVKQSFLDYHKKKLSVDSLYRLKCKIRSMVLSAFRKNGFTKKSKTQLILGCSFEELKIHIESQFNRGMNWDNHGEWHIDHIMPLSMAKNEDEIIRLNHYKNLRPLWAKDNLQKGHKRIDELVLF